MTEEANGRAAELAELIADIVSGFVSNNSVPVPGLSDLIASVHRSLSGLREPIAIPAKELVPAVNPKKSVFPDYVICLEDGVQFKSLKRHLRVVYGLTPDDYRAKWGLPRDYPMVAPNYSATRSALAKSAGLGRSAARFKAAPASRVTRSPVKREEKA